MSRPRTGHTATVTFSGSGWSMPVRSITGNEQTRESLEITNLSSSTYKKYIADDLVEPGEFALEFYWATSSGSTIVLIATTAESATLTFPIPASTASGSSWSGGATLTGTGFCTRYKFPDFNTGEVMMGELTFKFDGDTGPTFTPPTS